jgi:hypothetical protein
MKKNATGICECGCGTPTNLDRFGNPRRFVRGHNRRGAGHGWIERGYHYISINGRKTAFHRWLIEQMLGRPLSSDEIVHHVDGDPMNNDPDNLVILSRAEHTRIHAVGPRRKWTAEERERVIELRGKGMPVAKIASVLRRPISSTEWQLQRLAA